jgi:hypothetical protein
MEKLQYNFSSIKFSQLIEIVPLKKTLNPSKFDEWFKASYEVSNEDTIFLKNLIDKHYLHLPSYSEEDLKMKFISYILGKVEFMHGNINDFYHASLRAEVNGVLLNGFADYMVATGVKEPQKPYFFIQEFKPTQADKDVEDQLLAELLAATALNQVNIMRGAYIIGQNWRFCILEKEADGNYFFYVSKQFDCLEIDTLKLIYKHLQIVKLLYCKD